MPQHAEKPRHPSLSHNPSVAKYPLTKGTQVEVRRKADGGLWRPHTMRKTVVMRTTKRVHDTLYLEYLEYEVRYRNPSFITDERFHRY